MRGKPGRTHRIHPDALLADRRMTLAEPSRRLGVAPVTLSVLKNGRARAIRFSALARLCTAPECTPGDLIGYRAVNPTSGLPSET